MAYTKYSLTPANNNATPPDGAPEGMLPSAVNDTMRDMMAQIRDVGDGIRNGTYTMTAPVITGGSITGVALSGNTFTNPVITGGSINNTPIGASTANTGAFTTLSASGATTFSGATVVSGSLTANTFSSSGATITGGSINSTAIGGSTAAAGAFTTLSASGAFSANGGATLGDASGDALTINSSAVSIPNGLNFDSNTLVIDATNDRIGIGTSSPVYKLDVTGIVRFLNGSTPFIVDSFGAVQAPGGIYVNTTGTRHSGINSAGDDLRFRVGNSDNRMVLDSSGNLGLGTASPRNVAGYTSLGINNTTGALFDLFVGGTRTVSLSTTNSETNLLTITSIPLVLGTAGTERMRITSTGNVGIGTSSPSQKLEIAGTGSTTLSKITTTTGANAVLSSSTGGNFYFGIDNSAGTFFGTAYGRALYSDGAYPIIFYTNATEKMRLDSSGNLGLGVTPSTGISGWSHININSAGSTFRSNGTNVDILQNSTGNGNYQITAAASLYRQAGGSHSWWNAPSGTAGNAIVLTQAMTLDASGNLLVGITSARANAGDVQVSKGISFPATQSAQSDANTLDDYEEGTWTPTYIGATTAGTTTYTVQSGRYTKIGRQVTVHFDLDVSAATGTGNLIIGGLPFSCGYTTTGSIITNFFNWSGGTYVALNLDSGATTMSIFGLADDAAWTVQQITNEGLRIIGSITYIV